MWANGVASPTLIRRTEWACKLFEEGRFDLIVLSGGAGKHGPAEAEVMAGIAIERGIPNDALVLDRAATRTMDTAAFAARMSQARERHFVAVTDIYHAPRTWLAFRTFRLEVDVSCPPLGRETRLSSLTRSILREIPATLVYFLYFLRKRA